MLNHIKWETRLQVGETFGVLVVVSPVFRDSHRRPLVTVKCVECGHEKSIRVDHLTTRNVQCTKHRSPPAKASVKGHPQHGAYRSWIKMLDRCYNMKHPHYRHYGGRGIVVCDRWRESFEAFAADMGDRPQGMTLDRIDNDRNYEPGNCRWATYAEQNANKSNGTLVTFRGETKSVTEWAPIVGLSRFAIYARLKAGWTPERALTMPMSNRGFRAIKALKARAVAITAIKPI